ncbi:LysR family transcriptional regulator [Massilia sp. GCM10023247]|uniref:LysR family transcriptional regulator n=1 Tax=Massilia sp. GCM10023247 TaxID=3252643 RepID=UPI00361CB66A
METPHRTLDEGKAGAARRPEAANRLPHGHISLKEWNTLLAVVRNDGFARAAEVLHISQPAISYTIAKIEERLGISLLRTEGRRARITAIGQQLLSHVEPLLLQAAQVEAIARELRASWRPEVRLAVADDFPTRLLIGAIHSYSGGTPGATVLLTEGKDEAVQQLLLKREAALGIVGHLAPGLEGDVLVESEYLPVAHPAHPLFKLGRPLSDADLRHAVEIGIEGDGAQPAPQRWQVGSLETAEKAVAEGIGYGWLPGHQVREALAAGRLALLPLAGYPPRTCRFYLACLAAKPPADEVARLKSVLLAAVGAASTPG